MKSISSLFIVVFFTIFASSSIAQVDWTKHEDPVLIPGESGSWNDLSLYPFCILFIDDMYHTWYGGHDGSYARIGYASSEDGINWIPFEGNPVLDVGLAGSWEDEEVYSPYVLYENNTFHMWYAGFDGFNARIGYATSTDKVTWTKYEGNPVMDYGAGNWEGAGVLDPCIYFDGFTYQMWYCGTNVSSTTRSVGYATSTDKVTWTKYEGNPVLTGYIGEWDSPHIRAPHVSLEATKYHMWYNGMTATSGLNYQIGYATSPDGITWTKYEDNPILKPSDESWDSRWVGYANVLWDSTGEQYKMWYGGGSEENSNGKFGYATALPTGIIDEFVSDLPGKFKLMQNYPNPFNPTTKINYELPITNYVELNIFNLLGQKVATLVNEKQNAGYHQIEWDASGFASGVYYYRLSTNTGYVETKKLVFMK